MASVKALNNGKYRVFVCDGRQADGRINRFTKVIEAKNENEAKKKRRKSKLISGAENWRAFPRPRPLRNWFTSGANSRNRTLALKQENGMKAS